MITSKTNAHLATNERGPLNNKQMYTNTNQVHGVHLIKSNTRPDIYDHLKPSPANDVPRLYYDVDNSDEKELPHISVRPGHVVKNIQRFQNSSPSSKNSTGSSQPVTSRSKQSHVDQYNPSHGSKEDQENKRTKYRQKGDIVSKTGPDIKLLYTTRQKHSSYSDQSSTDKQKLSIGHLTDSNVRTHLIGQAHGKQIAKDGVRRHSEIEDKDRTLLGQPTGHKLELCDFVDRDVIGGDEVRTMCFGPTKITYLDYVASGRPLKSIENYIRQNVMPNYANTHTEVSYYAAQTTKFREEAREIIKESVHASENDAVIFCGSGSTSAIHKVIHAMDMKKSSYKLSPIVLIGPYEHHSNILPWIEIKAKEIQDSPNRLVIGSFSAASNVTGILTDTVAVCKIMHKYGGLAFFDYACAAPYVEIDINCIHEGPHAYKDAIFISTHKFLGGPQTPGILIAKIWVFKNKVPHGVGGGTVVFVRRQNHKYYVEPEHREEGGTPAIIESIRAGLVFKLKETFTSRFIMDRESEFFRRAASAWSEHPNILILGSLTVDRLPIFSMLFRNSDTGRLLHHDFVAMLLNYLFGLQVRSGCACAALYGLELMGMTEEVAQRYEKFITESKINSVKENKETPKDNHVSSDYEGLDNIIFKPEFVRLNLPYFLPEKCLNFIIKAVVMMADHGWKMLPLFDFDRKTGKWWFRQEQNFQPSKSLKDISFSKGFPDVKQSDSLDSIRISDAKTYKRFPGLDYDEILERATYIINDVTQPGSYDLNDQTHEYTDDADELRWFMLPSEASDMIHNRKVSYVAPKNLPFLPVTLAEKLKKR
ncbi:hypothetical protein Btru_043916 [Bulinus truncatus]|nr:hypothetical protein Btru_043916 [Bulinus truncatus]